MPPGQGIAFFQNRDAEVIPVFREFQCRENTAWTGADDQYVVNHFLFHFLFSLQAPCARLVFPTVSAPRICLHFAC